MQNANFHKIFSFDRISPKLECGVYEYLCYPSVGTQHINANGKRVMEVSIQLYCLRGIPNMLKFAKTTHENESLCYVRHPMNLFALFAIPKSIFIR